MATTLKGFIKNWNGEYILPITRGELVVDSKGKEAFHSEEFLADIDKKLPGLMSWTEKQMLTGGGSGGIKDIYDRLNYINQGYKVNGNAVKFYSVDDKNIPTPTPINISGMANQINIVVNNQEVQFGLYSFTQNGANKHEVSNTILRNITVDQFGRVTAVTGSNLSNEDIPDLDGQTISNATFSNCNTDTEELPENASTTAIVNKKYVDDKFDEVTRIATDALTFGGSVSNAADAITRLTEKKHKNHYFKAIENFTIPAEHMYDKTQTQQTAQDVKIGDTLIIYQETSSSPHKYVYVPSGNEDETYITVKNQNDLVSDAKFKRKFGEVVFNFDSKFKLTSNANTVTIDMQKATAEYDGYLSADDWDRFNNYESGLKVEYTTDITTATPGYYTIGSLNIGGKTQTVYGVNNITTLELSNGSDTILGVEYNPILKFSESGTNANTLNITYKGINGITIRKDNNNNVEFSANNIVNELSKKYLKISNGYQFDAIIGSVTTEGETSTVHDGLTDYREFTEFETWTIDKFRNLHHVISNSLNDETKDIHYGSTRMVEIISVTI